VAVSPEHHARIAINSREYRQCTASVQRPACSQTQQLQKPSTVTQSSTVELQGKGRGKKWICIAPRREHTSKALRYGKSSQRISQFYLHTPRNSSANGMNHTCLFLSSWSWSSFTDPGRMEGWVRPGWLVTYRDKCRAPGTEPGHGHPSKH